MKIFIVITKYTLVKACDHQKGIVAWWSQVVDDFWATSHTLSGGQFGRRPVTDYLPSSHLLLADQSPITALLQELSKQSLTAVFIVATTGN